MNKISDIRALHKRHWSRKSLSEVDDALGEVLGLLDELVQAAREVYEDVTPLSSDYGRESPVYDRAVVDLQKLNGLLTALKPFEEEE